MALRVLDIACSIQCRPGNSVASSIQMTYRRISIVWRSKKSRCETETIPVTIPPDVWTHIAVVFKPVEEERMDEILGIVAIHCFLIPRKYGLPDGSLFLY